MSCFVNGLFHFLHNPLVFFDCHVVREETPVNHFKRLNIMVKNISCFFSCLFSTHLDIFFFGHVVIGDTIDHRRKPTQQTVRLSCNGEYPKFAIWENVRGAFSSSKGEDFRCVLERFARIVEPDVSIPRPSGKNGKWAKSGAISGNGWSLAWRLFDAKYWGVAQRRQRIALVMDFGGQRASEILFERTSMSGDSCESIPAWKTFARTPEASVAGYDRMVESRNSVTGGAESEGTRRSGREGIGRVLESDHRETSTRCTEPAAYTLKIRSGCEGGGKGALVQTELSATISTLQDQTLICLAENPSLHNLKQKF